MEDSNQRLMKTSHSLNLLSLYSRNDLKKLFEIKDATINNGIFKPKDHSSIWLFVTKNKTPDRTEYYDDFDGQILIFEGQTTGRTDKLILDHEKQNNEIILFYRDKKGEHANYAFKYLGRFQYISYKKDNPKRFTLHALDLGISDFGEQEKFEETVPEIELIKGTERTRVQTYYERNPRLRSEALKLHGTKCYACGFDFGEKYGVHGEGFIEIHQLHPVTKNEGEKSINPINDLIPLCSNCHRMVHRKTEMLSIDELKSILGSKEI